MSLNESVFGYCSQLCNQGLRLGGHRGSKGAITSKIKRARYAVIGCKLKQNANEGCNSCASLARLKFYCTFYFTCDRSLRMEVPQRGPTAVPVGNSLGGEAVGSQIYAHNLQFTNAFF